MHLTWWCFVLTLRSNPSYCFWPSSSHGHSSYALTLLYGSGTCEYFVVCQFNVDEAAEKSIQTTKQERGKQGLRAHGYCAIVQAVQVPDPTIGRRKTSRLVEILEEDLHAVRTGPGNTSLRPSATAVVETFRRGEREGLYKQLHWMCCGQVAPHSYERGISSNRECSHRALLVHHFVHMKLRPPTGVLRQHLLFYRCRVGPILITAPKARANHVMAAGNVSCVQKKRLRGCLLLVVSLPLPMHSFVPR